MRIELQRYESPVVYGVFDCFGGKVGIAREQCLAALHGHAEDHCLAIHPFETDKGECQNSAVGYLLAVQLGVSVQCIVSNWGS